MKLSRIYETIIQRGIGFDPRGREQIEKYLKLKANINITNLCMYNTNNALTHYESPLEIMEEFYEHRLIKYKERKKYYLKRKLLSIFLQKKLKLFYQTQNGFTNMYHT